MKIGGKLMLSNILISLVAMVLLSMIISNIVSNYIEDDIKDDIIKENAILTKWLSYNKFIEYSEGELTVKLDYYEKTNRLPIVSGVFRMDNNPQLLDTMPNDLQSIITPIEINQMLEQDLNSVYTIVVNDKSYLAYNDDVKVTIEDKEHSLLVATLLSNALIVKITGQITRILIASIVIVSILSIVVTSYNERMITKPINVLMKITEKIAKKNFDEKADLHTGDELESLGNAINHMSESLKTQDIQQKKFYENISHELKTPLTVISGYAQGIKSNILEDNTKALDTIINECNSLKKQLENVIYLSKLDTTNEPYNFEVTSINELISSALQKLDSVIIINELDIIYEPIPDVRLCVDKEKIARALINILSNCIKYTKDTIYINTKTSEEWISVEISDNGNGFTRVLLDNPFSRIIVGEKEGSGIGLSIINKVISGHRGRITLANKKEGGAIYIMELPRNI